MKIEKQYISIDKKYRCILSDMNCLTLKLRG